MAGTATAKARGRLRLRALAPADGEALAAAVEASRDLLRRRLGAGHPVMDAAGFISRAAAAQERGEAVAWGLFELRGGLLAGVASLERLPEAPELEGWVREDLQGRGYATEAARAVLDRAFRALGLHRVGARIDPANRAARTALRRAGFRYEGRLRAGRRLNGRWVDQECWGVLRSEWSR